MRRDVAQKLETAVILAENNFSSLTRDKNYNQETFTKEKIFVLSEFTAAVYFIKNTGKRAVAFFFFVDVSGGKWYYFFPTDSHILGMIEFSKYKIQIENNNLEFNFKPTEEIIQ